MERALCPVLIGREAELTALEDALLAANRGEGGIVLLAGEAGLGKTRLATELQNRALKIGMTVLWGGCSEAELALPYLPFLEAMGNFLAASDINALREQLGPVRLELAHLFPQLEPGASSREQGDPTQAKLRLFEAIVSLLRIPAEQHGLLVVVEDLHWADASTRELLDYMARRLAGMRLMLLVSYRSDELHRRHPLTPMIQGWRRTKSAEIVDLKPLPTDGVAAMISAIFDDEETTPEFANLLHTRTEGNPFVLEEYLKAALDRGDIYRGPQKWQRKALDDLRLPQTVKDTILLRLERLLPEQAEILQIAAVLGPAWNYDALVAVSGKDVAAVQNTLHAAIEQQLLEEEPNGNGRYRFRHALTREAISDDMIAPRREQLHSRAADMLAKLPGAAPMDLAYHLFAANRWEDAIPIGIKAAEDAERNAAFLEAARVYERLLGHIHDDLMRGELLCRLGNAYFVAGDPTRGQRYLEQGLPLLEARQQRRAAAHYRLTLGRCLWERSRPDLAREHYERARAELEPDGPSEDLALAYIRLAGLHMFDFEYEQCLEMAQRAKDVAEAAHAESTRIWAGVFLGGGLSGMGRIDEAIAQLETTIEEALSRNLLLVARNAVHNAIVTRLETLRGAGAQRLLRYFEPLRGGARMLFFEPFDQAGIYLYLGYPTKAVADYERALALAREGEFFTAQAWIRTDMATALGAAGRTQDALQCLPPEESIHEMQDMYRRKRELISLLVDNGDHERALAAAITIFERERWGSLREHRVLFDAAVPALIDGGRIDLAEQLVMRTRDDAPIITPYQDRMEGRLALATGKTGAAREHLRAAVTGFAAASAGLEEMRTRRLFAAAELAAGDRSAAQAELRRVVEMADAREAIFEGQAARTQLHELGVEVANEPRTEGRREPDQLVATAERLVTVLFLDIRGYSTLSSKASPDRVADTVASLYRWARQEIERHHGLVDKYEGDAVMATFNATGARLDHAVQALKAAIAIRDKAAAAGLPIGAGIAVGAAVVGKLTAGSPISTYGEVTNLASRLQGQAAAGEIVLSEEAYRRIADWIRERALVAKQERLELKGFASPVTAFRLSAGAPKTASLS